MTGWPVRPAYTGNAHDAAWLTLLGASWAGLQEPDLGGRSLARGLRHLSGGVPVTLGADVLTTARDRFRLGEAIDIEGVSGALDYDPVLEETSAPVEIWTIDAGATGFVSEYEVTP